MMMEFWKHPKNQLLVFGLWRKQKHDGTLSSAISRQPMWVVSVFGVWSSTDMQLYLHWSTDRNVYNFNKKSKTNRHWSLNRISHAVLLMRTTCYSIRLRLRHPLWTQLINRRLLLPSLLSRCVAGASECVCVVIVGLSFGVLSAPPMPNDSHRRVDVKRSARNVIFIFFGAPRSDKDKLQLCVPCKGNSCIVANFPTSNAQPCHARLALCVRLSTLRINFIRRKSELFGANTYLFVYSLFLFLFLAVDVVVVIFQQVPVNKYVHFVWIERRWWACRVAVVVVAFFLSLIRGER